MYSTSDLNAVIKVKVGCCMKNGNEQCEEGKLKLLLLFFGKNARYFETCCTIKSSSCHETPCLGDNGS